MRRASGLVAALLALALTGVAATLAGCGGGDGRAPGEPPPEAGLEAPEDADALRAAQEAENESPASANFQLGTHYDRLSPTQPTSSSPDKVEVAEIFWYGCPHCYSFDPYLAEWQMSAPEYVSFVRIPAVWNPVVELHARAFYTAEALGRTDEMHEALFAEIHENRNLLDSKEALAEFFGRFGVDAETFERTFDSFDVHTKVQRANELSRRYRVTSVPSIVVNGKYVSTASMAGSYERLVALIDELAAAERPGN